MSIRTIALLLTLAGLAISVWLIGRAGALQVLAAVAAIGPLGFLALCACTLGVLLLLGGAWFAVAPGLDWPMLPTFVWARTAREAATDVLPFSQLGGLVVGARTLLSQGVGDRLVYASMIADLTTELGAQLLFTLAGVAMLLVVLASAPLGTNLIPLALAGVAATMAIMAGFAFAQRPMLRLTAALGGRLLPGAAVTVAGVGEQLALIYARPKRVLAAFLLNLLAWLASAASAWVALRFMGSHAPLWIVLTIEALIFTLRSVAFAVPGAIGVQEAAYAMIGPLFGVAPTTALALSLVKRARDLAIGVPAIIAWQLGEARALKQAAAP